MSMRLLSIALTALLLPAGVLAAPWQFEKPVAVTAVTGPKLFHHLESSGRHNIAVSGSSVAVAWEDERDGMPRVYLAQKRMADAGFQREVVVSGQGEAFEPSLIGLGMGRFAVAWEEDGQVHARLISGQTLGPVFRVTAGDAVQASLAAAGEEVFLAAAERSGRFARIVLHRLQVGNGARLSETSRCAVDAEPPADEQLYPALALQQGQVIVAWEDRRPGHTIIMASQSGLGDVCTFRPPQRISLRPEREQKMPYGKGHGVARVAMAAYGASGVFAAWADKRNFREGYDIYGARWRGQEGFGANERVQDEFGGVARQWHSTVAGHAQGMLVVAWDDERDGDANVMMSWREEGEWSEDVMLPGAGGAGEQVHPSIVLDNDGNLHAAWVERDTIDGPTRLRYVFGRQEAGER